MVAFAKKHVEVFRSDVLINENELLTRGAKNEKCGNAASDLRRAIEATIARRSRTPQAVLQ
jgi:hypothetical protein